MQSIANHGLSDAAKLTVLHRLTTLITVIFLIGLIAAAKTVTL
jgi:hypothetical protein